MQVNFDRETADHRTDYQYYHRLIDQMAGTRQQEWLFEEN
jgi:hypothetical protein